MRLLKGALYSALILLPILSSTSECRGQTLPVAPELFIDEFVASEGLTFNAEGRLFIGANRAIWEAKPDGSVELITAVFLHLGQAGIGETDILAADFGPSSMLRHGPNDDGIIWRVSPDGRRSIAATGIADPNFILMEEGGTSYLVSDDFTHNIYRVALHDGSAGRVELWSDAVPHPNGLAFSLDGKTLYVAQIFTGLAPLGFSDALWAMPLENGQPAGPAAVVARTGEGGLDGLAVDETGRIYIADNGAGKIWRFDPESNEMTLVAEGMSSVASLVFGEGDFDAHSIYATSTFGGGGKIWRIPVGVGGARPHR
ncbi:MAG: SMP-30/gluconolactonase/LRE family protein [Thermoanaerobaculia bacterium]